MDKIHISPEQNYVEVNKAFSKQSFRYDEEDTNNSMLQVWRKQVYAHVDAFLKPASKILELNSGTGIDAVHFVKSGHRVHCVEISDGMIEEISQKIEKFQLQASLSYQQLSFESLDQVSGKFDYVFSNFGGLNCCNDLGKVTGKMAKLLNSGARVTWVIMPPVCGWELVWMLKGDFKKAVRRFQKDGTMAHLEGEYFKTYYYSLKELKRAFGDEFKFLKSEGLGSFSPPPSATRFTAKYKSLTRLLCAVDQKVKNYFPFNRWADHIIVTFQKR